MDPEVPTSGGQIQTRSTSVCRRCRAYNRTEFVEQRREMLQTWANYLDHLRSGKDAPSAKAQAPATAVGQCLVVPQSFVAEKQILALNLNNSKILFI
jgi:hypothetical protein